MKGIYLDGKLLIPSLLLFSLGLLVMQSVSPGLVGTQFLFGIIALITYIVISQIDIELIFALHSLFSFASLGFLVLTFIIGELTRGTHRWLSFGFFNFQPSEIAKPFMIITLSILIINKSKSFSAFISKLLLVYLPLILIFIQPDLGTFLVILSGLLVVQFSHFRLSSIILVLIGSVLILPPVYQYLLKDYQKDRIQTFINPYTDPAGKGYHVIQSIISIGSGGGFGKGLGQGSQSQLRFLPEQHTDFVFASLSEELGLIGATLTLTLFGILYYRIYFISQHLKNQVGTTVTLGVLGMLIFQVFVNVGMNIGLAPVTGITLPFISYGGSSLISWGLLLGIISSISRSSLQRL